MSDRPALHNPSSQKQHTNYEILSEDFSNMSRQSQSVSHSETEQIKDKKDSKVKSQKGNQQEQKDQNDSLDNIEITPRGFSAQDKLHNIVNTIVIFQNFQNVCLILLGWFVYFEFGVDQCSEGNIFLVGYLCLLLFQFLNWLFIKCYLTKNNEDERDINSNEELASTASIIRCLDLLDIILYILTLTAVSFLFYNAEKSDCYSYEVQIFILISFIVSLLSAGLRCLVVPVYSCF